MNPHCSQAGSSPHSRGDLTDYRSMHKYETNASSSSRTRQRKVKREWMRQACCYVCAGNNESYPVCGATPAASAPEIPSIPPMAPPSSNASPKTYPKTYPKLKDKSKTTAKAARRFFFLKSSQEPTTSTTSAGGVDEASKKSPALNDVKLVRRKKSTMFRREDDSGDAASEQPGRAHRRNTSPVPTCSDNRRYNMQPQAASPMRYSDRPTRLSPRHADLDLQLDSSTNVELNEYDDAASALLEDSVPTMRDLRPIQSNFHRHLSSVNQEHCNPHDQSELSPTLDHVFYPIASAVLVTNIRHVQETSPVRPQHSEVEQEQPIPHLRAEEDFVPARTPPRPTLQQRHQQQEDKFLGWTAEEQEQSWVCGACTFENENALHLTCSLCSTLRVKDASQRTTSSSALHAEEPLGDDSQKAATRSNSERIGEDWLETLRHERIQELIEIQEELLQEYH